MIDASSVRVLLVEDDEDDFTITRDLLSEIPGGQFTLDWVKTFEAGLEAMSGNQHDVVLVDYRLGAHNGIELLREAQERGCQAPVILLTGAGEHQVDLEAMQAGAADYLVKGHLRADSLERSIRYAIENHRARVALRTANEELEQRVRERTAELQRSNRDLEQFANVVARDLREPVRAITKYIDQIKARKATR